MPNTKTNTHTTSLYAILLVLLCTPALSQFSSCPAANPLQVASDSITISSTGRIPLVSGTDIQCYNYTLATIFSCTPGVAIGTSSFTQPSTPSKVNTVPTFSSRSRLWTPTVMEWFPLSCAPNGDIHSGANLPFLSLLKGQPRWKQATTRSILDLSPHATQERPLLPSSLLAANPLLWLLSWPSWMALRSALSQLTLLIWPHFKCRS